MLIAPKVRLLLPTLIATAALQLGGPALAHAAVGDPHPVPPPKARHSAATTAVATATSAGSQRQAADGPAIATA